MAHVPTFQSKTTFYPYLFISNSKHGGILASLQNQFFTKKKASRVGMLKSLESGAGGYQILICKSL